LRAQKVWLTLLLTLFLLGVLYSVRDQFLVRINYTPWMDIFILGRPVQVPLEVTSQALDIVNGARQEVLRRTRYDSSEYPRGYPPEGRGMDTDVVWRGFKAAGYDLKGMVEQDIKAYPYAYAGMALDPEMDFRRVSVLTVFFRRQAVELTTEVKPGDVDNLSQWQPGDIVVFGPPSNHIAIISDRRRKDGVPLVIHNAGPRATEGDYLLRWSSKITYHFRYIL
jgi:hypothetical protein